MGIAVDLRPQFMGRLQPKAIVGRTLPNDLIIKTRLLLINHESIPIKHFATLFYLKFDQLIDATAIGFDNGLVGFFNELSDMVDVKQTPNGLACSLRINCRPRQTDSQKDRSTSSKRLAREKDQASTDFGSFIKRTHLRRSIFNYENGVLWPEHFVPIAFKSDVVLALSPLEAAAIRNSARVEREIAKVHKALSRYPNGIRLNEISTVVKIDKRLFNAPSLDTVVVECPELFYCVEPGKDGEEPIVYDGITNTHEDINNVCMKSSNIHPYNLAYKAIVSGIYQKTLILIRTAGGDGLKLGVWHQSMLINFPNLPGEPFENELISMCPLTLFSALAFLDMVNIRSHVNSKNDLRIHLPMKIVNFNKICENWRATESMTQLKVTHQAIQI